jgi:hypothetical protein
MHLSKALERDPEKACPALGLRGGNRLSEKVMFKQRDLAAISPFTFKSIES